MKFKLILHVIFRELTDYISEPSCSVRSTLRIPSSL
jgi:hypothetical protein